VLPRLAEKAIPPILWRIVVIAFFILLLAAGVILHDDYGGYTDEINHLRTGAIQYKMILSLFMPEAEIPEIPILKLNELPQLEQYINRYYGEAVMLPTLFVAALPGVSFTDAAFLNFRRFYTFLNFFLAVICFYRLIRLRFSNELLALLAAAMLVLSPRFFAESFYNSKDIVFFSWFLISIYLIAEYFFQPSRGRLFLFAAAAALACNTRIYGMVLYPAFLILMGVSPNRTGESFWKKLKQPVFAVALSLFFYWLISPFLWQDPLGNFLASFNFASHQVGVTMENLTANVDTVSVGNAELFMGKLIAPKDYWYYLPVWMGITIPVWYLVLFVAGIFSTVKRLFSQRLDAGLLFDLFTAGVFFGSLLAIISASVTLYNGWRHVYFLYGPLLYLSVLGLAELGNFKSQHALRCSLRTVLTVGLCAASMLTTGVWMVKNHPLDFVYFNEIGRKNADQFSRDYWGVSSKSCMLYLSSVSSGQSIRLAANNLLSAGAIDISLMRLPRSIQDQFELFWQPEHADYLCISYDKMTGNSYPVDGFELMKSFTVDDYTIASAYQRIKAAE